MHWYGFCEKAINFNNIMPTTQQFIMAKTCEKRNVLVLNTFTTLNRDLVSKIK